MITCDLVGGLGNQLFQIFNVISYAIKSGNKFCFLNKKQLGEEGTGCTVRYTFWDTFFVKLQPFLISALPQMNFIRENGFHYQEFSLNLIVNKDVSFSGYFQSEKYFKTHFHTICNLIGLENMKNVLLENLKLKEADFDNTISLHFRIGDYKKTSQFHPIMTIQYYKNALFYFNNRFPDTPFNILFFCEDVDYGEVLKMVFVLESSFQNYKFARASPQLADWEQMLNMSLCRHNIIGNSTFSWWGAYFNNHKDKVVCYPSVWFGKIANLDTRDLFPEGWVKIEL